jgi:transcription antitermination factor NusG
MNEEKKWFVFYTKSRQEKKVRDFLWHRAYEVFLPTQKVIRQWSDRKKRVEVPLFSSYIFVRVFEHQVVDVLKVPGIAWAIRYNGKPAILQPKEYSLIQRFLATGLTIEIFPAAEFQSGDWVEVIDGPLKGAVGQVTTSEKTRFTVLLEAIGQVMRVEIDPMLLKKV